MNQRVPVGWFLPLRLLTGAALVATGYEKLASGWLHGDILPGVLGGWLEKHMSYSFFVPVVEVARAHPGVFGTLVTFGELGVGSCFLLGLFSRPAALMGTLLLGSISFGSGQSIAPPGNAVVMAVVSLTFLFTAPGRFAGLDQALRGKLPAWLV